MINIAGRNSSLIALVSLLLLAGCSRDKDATPVADEPDDSKVSSAVSLQQNHLSIEVPTYSGSTSCSGCHQKESTAWEGSHHAHAMRSASEESVLGNFNNSTFTYRGITTTFYKREGTYYVETEGMEGNLEEFPIAFTFGVAPLQQYLIQFPGGRLQALSIAWDSRPKADGGQRWFHLYPDEIIDHSDSLHWSGNNQNWNFMCADCHSTNLQKNYDLNTDTFQTSWSEMNVACESCHGPASKHLEWAYGQQPNLENFGFSIELQKVNINNWKMNLDSGIASIKAAKTSTEMQICAQCHSRRATFLPGAVPGSQFLDHYNPALLQPPLYHVDGQINEEVYVYGSFLQSKMYAAGVTCSNCHEPHGLQLRSNGDGICAQCHLPGKFAQTEHHLHPVNSPGARCVSCHMPAKNYMLIDSRRDHSFRIPRPDLSDQIKTPNACTNCHKGKSNQWAAEILRDRFGPPERTHFGEALYAGFSGQVDAEGKLSELIIDSQQPTIARATAITLLPQYLSRHSVQLLQSIAQGDQPLLSLALAQSLDRIPEPLRPPLGIPLLYEPERVTRSLAANALAAFSMENYSEPVRQQFSLALREYVASEHFNSDRPESLANLAGLHRQRGNIHQAEAFYRRAIKKAPDYTPAYINLADLYRAEGREKESENTLRKALGRAQGNAAIHHSLGLSLIRQGLHSEAISYLKKAAEAKETDSRYIYVYAIALHSADNPTQALAILEKGFEQFPTSVDILQALISINRESGDLEKAKKYEAFLAGNN
ncbi:tetratricopeptide repeat protein [Microbulbifer sp. THAF38]|uniref:tetratricopeptide repeat protein n=1 Tax=Microbulbifer sp. THAF38 TaxID=2587856 RepID=UPI00126900FA|nr:tetratricopeptide repeat protein [Microbulbifer sp. THAF38]QFT55266.1 TPR repeat-containing protein YrrB [Microbulbifer sp. THAF38]